MIIVIVINWFSGFCIASEWSWVWTKPGWPRTRSYRQRGSGEPHVTLWCLWHHSPLKGLWDAHLWQLNVKGNFKHVTLSEQTLEPGCLDSNLDTTPHWLGKLFNFSDPRFSHLQNGYDHSTYLIGLLWRLIELIHKVDFRTLYTIITILKQNLKPCRVSVQPKEDFCQKCVKVEGTIGRL